MVHMEDASEIFASTFSWTPLNLDLSTEQGESPYISLNVSKHCLSPCEPHNRREWCSTLEDPSVVKVKTCAVCHFSACDVFSRKK